MFIVYNIIYSIIRRVKIIFYAIICFSFNTFILLKDSNGIIETIKVKGIWKE